MTDSIKKIFEENGYKVSLKETEIKIAKKHPFLAIFLYSLLFAITIPLLFFGDYRVLLLLVLLIGFPFIYRKWMLPVSIVISDADQTIFINRHMKNEPKIVFDDIQSFEVDEKVLSSDVSPFKEGYQDFVYTFSIKTNKDKALDLFHLEFRKPEQKLIGSIFDYFNKIFKVSGQPSKI